MGQGRPAQPGCLKGVALPTHRLQAGDIVPKKKPDPAIYLLAAKELVRAPSLCSALAGTAGEAMVATADDHAG